MRERYQALAANTLMTAGLSPFVATFVWFAWTRDARGDEALANIYMLALACLVSFVAVLFMAFPALFWSRRLSRAPGNDSALARSLRVSVMVVLAILLLMFSLFASLGLTLW
jgi:hypothetical protein